MSAVKVLSRTLARTVHFGRISVGSQLAAISSVAADIKGGSESVVKPFNEIPGPRGLYRWPLLGTLLHFKPFTKYNSATVHLLMNDMLSKYGPVVRLRLGRSVVLISEPRDIETVFRHEGKYPYRRASDIGLVYAKRNNLRDALVDLQGADWHSVRTHLNKRLMKVDSAHYYLKPQNAVADDFVAILSSRHFDADDMADLFFRFAAESVGVVCFNARLGFLNLDSQDKATRKFLQASKDYFVYMNKTVTGQSFAHTWYRNDTYQGYERCSNVLKANSRIHTQKAKEVLEHRKREGTIDPEEPNLLLSLLSDSTLNEDDIGNTIDSLYVAGTDSTAKNMQAFFYNLAKNPDKQEKLRQEVLEVMGANGSVLTESIAKMPYMKACLKESFRLVYPSVTGTVRTIPVDIVLGGYKIPAGTEVILHNPKTAIDCAVDGDKYIPERWLRSSEGRRQENIPNTAVLPFGHGPRNCIGQRFAQQEIYLGTAKVLQKLKINVKPESENTSFSYSIFVQPDKPISFTFTKISD